MKKRLYEGVTKGDFLLGKGDDEVWRKKRRRHRL
jgi:hypothetical protein